MYSEKVMDHFNNPRNVGELENPSGVGTVGNAKCGDIMRIYLDIDNLGVIQDAKFKKIIDFSCYPHIMATCHAAVQQSFSARPRQNPAPPLPFLPKALV